MDIKELFPYIVSAVSLLLAVLAYKRNDRQDTTADATERATLSADVRYIRSSVDEIKLENRAIKKDVDELKTKVIEIETSTKLAHKLIDELKG